MKKKMFVVFAATIICGMCLFTSCKQDNINLNEKIIGKWILAETNGNPTLTNNKYVITFTSNTKGYLSASLSSYTEISSFWGDHQEIDVDITGNMIKNTMVVNEHLTVVDEMIVTSITDTETKGDLKILWIVDDTVVRTVEESIRTVRVNKDYSNAILGTWEGQVTSDDDVYTDRQFHRWQFNADGIYVYFRHTDDGQWEDEVNAYANFFIDGTLLCMRWKNTGEDQKEHYEWWELESIQNGEMKWKGLRKHEDGSTFTASFGMTIVSDSKNQQ